MIGGWLDVAMSIASTPRVRPCLATDLPAVYDICVRTADSGGDARGQYSSDRLMGDIFAAPYVRLAPEHAYVLDDGTGAAVGYVLGAPDTARFVERYRAEWIPALADVWSPPVDPPVTREDFMLGLHFHPERMLGPQLATHPAHLHIDLLPQWQRRGFGRVLIERLLAGLAAAGVPAVHLGMLSSNTAARAFYDRLGFVELPVVDAGPVTFLGRPTGPAAALPTSD
jgi:ribosomal protein S18 acetylase RimI-like enzyme